MDGWMDGWMDGRTNGQMKEQDRGQKETIYGIMWHIVEQRDEEWLNNNNMIWLDVHHCCDLIGFGLDCKQKCGTVIEEKYICSIGGGGMRRVTMIILFWVW
jgi:hypothetical protein